MPGLRGGFGTDRGQRAGPYLIAIVVLEEQEDLLLATNLIGMEEADVHDGLPVQVVFEDHGEVFYPVFERAQPEGAEV
jgi:uncharacterized protein